MGYTGGEAFEPNYDKIGDHTEAMLVEFDDSVTYNQLLAKFFAEHTPGESSRQYRSCIFYHDDDQRAAAEAVRDGLVGMGKRWVRHTAVEPASAFWQAEDYHQKYLAKMQTRFAGYAR